MTDNDIYAVERGGRNLLLLQDNRNVAAVSRKEASVNFALVFTGICFVCVISRETITAQSQRFGSPCLFSVAEEDDDDSLFVEQPR